jgi:hypothetical protein
VKTVRFWARTGHAGTSEHDGAPRLTDQAETAPPRQEMELEGQSSVRRTYKPNAVPVSIALMTETSSASNSEGSIKRASEWALMPMR